MTGDEWHHYSQHYAVLLRIGKNELLVLYSSYNCWCIGPHQRFEEQENARVLLYLLQRRQEVKRRHSSALCGTP